MEIERERDRAVVGWHDVHRVTRAGEQRMNEKRKRKKKWERRVSLCVWTYADNINTQYIHVRYLNRYVPAAAVAAEAAAVESWRDALANHVESSGSHQIPPSTFFFFLFFVSPLLYDRGAYLTIKRSWSLINKRRPSMLLFGSRWSQTVRLTRNALKKKKCSEYKLDLVS